MTITNVTTGFGATVCLVSVVAVLSSPGPAARPCAVRHRFAYYLPLSACRVSTLDHSPTYTLAP